MSAYDHARRYLEVQQWRGPILDRIAALEAERNRLRNVLNAINLRLSDGSMTFDDLMRAVSWCADEARAALEAGNG